MNSNILKTLAGGATAAMLMLGLQSTANAVTLVTISACQGALCASASDATTATIEDTTVGDYYIDEASGAFIEDATSQAANTTLNVRRTRNATAAGGSSDPLVLTVTVYGYMLPDGDVYRLFSTGAASVTRSSGSNEVIDVDWQAWVDFTNSGLLSLTNGQISCTPGGGPVASCNTVGGSAQFDGQVPFSMTVRTTLNFQRINSVWGSTGQAIITTAVPEPASLGLLGLGLLGAGFAGRRRKVA